MQTNKDGHHGTGDPGKQADHANPRPKPQSKAESKSEPRPRPELHTLDEVLGVQQQPLIDAYYDSTKKEFLYKNSGGRWHSLGEGGIKRILASRGFNPNKHPEEMLSDADEVLLEIQDKRDVQFAGPLAGREAGYYFENGLRFLVTESPHLLEPKEGPWGTIQKILHGLLSAKDPEYGTTQIEIFLGWLSSAVNSLYGKNRGPGQVLAMAGPAGCGKSVLQNHLITPLLGGRSAKAGLFMQGRTDFNGELVGAEHLMLEDEHSDTSIKCRLALAANMKQIAVNEIQACHPKGRQIVNLRPFWRLTISLNDEPERLLVIPPLSDDLKDKVILLRAFEFSWPLPVETREEWAALMKVVENELPAFLEFLLGFKSRAEHHSNRYGVIAWHHPILAATLEEMSPESHLAILIARWMAADNLNTWKGTADELKTVLAGHHTTQQDSRDLLKWANATGTYLGRLIGKARGGLEIERCRSNDARRWVLNRSGAQSRSIHESAVTVSRNWLTP